MIYEKEGECEQTPIFMNRMDLLRESRGNHNLHHDVLQTESSLISRIFQKIGCRNLSFLPYSTTDPNVKIERIQIVGDLICYCFGYSEDDIQKDYMENGKSTIMEKIQMEKKIGSCHCGTKNPKGK